MAYNEHLAERMRIILDKRSANYTEKRMMGGLTFMVNDKMCCGIVKEDLMCRIDPEIYEDALKIKGCRAMDFTGRPMAGYVFINAEAIDKESDLESWIQKCLDFNPKAKSSKKK